MDCDPAPAPRYIISKKHHTRMIDNLRRHIHKKIYRSSFQMWHEYLVLRHQLRGSLKRMSLRRTRLYRARTMRAWECFVRARRTAVGAGRKLCVRCGGATT